MRPVPIPDEWVPPNFCRKVIAAPDGDLTNTDILPVEVLVGVAEDGIPRFIIRVLIEDEDLDQIKQGNNHFWISILGTRLPPFGVGMGIVR